MSPALRYLLHSLQIASFSDFGDYKGDYGHNSGAFSNQCRNTDYSTCVLSPDPLAVYNVTGTIYFSQVNDCGTLSDLRVGVHIAGFPDSDDVTKHGLHVHAFGDISEGCSSAGGHYNPLHTMHGGRLDSPGRRHVGDFGNLEVREGKVVTSFMDPIAKLSGRHSIVGRALVLHADQDDLGRGGNSGSRASGNAGPRLACCVIGIAEEPNYDKKSDIFQNGLPGRRAPSEIRFTF